MIFMRRFWKVKRHGQKMDLLVGSIGFSVFFGGKSVRPLQGINVHELMYHIPPIETELNLHNHFGKDDKIYICSFLGGESRLMTHHELVPVSMIHLITAGDVPAQFGPVSPSSTLSNLEKHALDIHNSVPPAMYRKFETYLFFRLKNRSQDGYIATLSIGHNGILCAMCKPGDLDLHLPQESGLSCSRMLLFVPCACNWDARRGLKIPNHQWCNNNNNVGRNCGEIYGIVGKKLDGVSVDIQSSV